MTEAHKSRYELWVEEEARKAQPTKRCSKCGEVKALSEYHKDRTKSTGIDAMCKICSRRPRKFKNEDDRFWKHFWDRVDKVGQCLIWQGQTVDGQPACRYMGKAKARVRRIVYRLAIGDLPDDMFVITTCNNPKCVSQRHMEKVDRPGLHVKVSNNAARGDSHGSRTHPEKVARGEQSWLAKLNTEKVFEIRRRFDQGESKASIARVFQVTRTTVRAVITGKTWAHVE